MRASALKNKPSLDALVTALCHDYARRADIIKNGSASRRSLSELEYLNYRIYGAAAEISGDELAEVYIEEIGESIGYAKSRDLTVSELSYKRRKTAIREEIAQKLYLL